MDQPSEHLNTENVQPTRVASNQHHSNVYFQLERVLTALPDTQTQLAVASERADLVLGDVKKLEIRSMLTDQTVEEMEQALSDAHNMSANTAAKVRAISSIQTVPCKINKPRILCSRPKTWPVS